MDAARLQQLVAETTWLRRLARSLVSDAATADDVVQETYLVAAERAPDDRPIEPWLARVARNVARMRGRSAARRSARELATGDDVDAPARPDQLVERVETQRLLTNLVLELGEPYRDVILLHFFEGLSSAAIARRLGVPDGTVRWRLKYALDDLRARLDARTEDRKAWLVPVAALAHTATPVAGVLVMKKLIAVAIALIVMAALFVVVRRGVVGSHDPVDEVATSSAHPGTVVAASAVPAWVVQAGVPARRIAGRVLFAGAPVAGASVALRAAAQPDVAIADATTAGDGTFAFATPPPASYQVIASAHGRSPAFVEINTSDPHARPDRLLLVLGNCRARAVGLVSDAASTPIAKARLRVRGLVGVDTGADGRYDMCLPPGATTVTVSADGYGTVMALFENDGMQRRDFMLVPEGVIHGRVVRADRTTPVLDAQVVVVSADNPIDWRGQHDALSPVSTRSDGDGHFQIGSLSPGRYHVSATAPGLGSTLVETFVEGGSQREVLVVVTARSRVSGRVVAEGQAVAGALVTAVGAANLAPASSVWSQSDGSFVLDGAPRGAIHWQVRGYEVASPSSTPVDKPEVAGVVLDVRRAASIRGRITLHGAPIADARVEYGHQNWSHGFSMWERTVRSGSDGVYVFDDVEPGVYKLDACSDADEACSNNGDSTAGAGGDGGNERYQVTVTASATAELDIELTASASVSGTVVDDHGAPVPSVAVALGDQLHVTTDASGAFRVAGMHPGDFVPRVFPVVGFEVGAFKPASGTDFAPIHVAGATSAITGVTLAIHVDRLTITGTVVDDHGAPVGDTRVEVADGVSDDDAHPRTRISPLPQTVTPNPNLVSSIPWTVTDSSGSFTLRDLSVARYDLAAHGADGSIAFAWSIDAGTTGVTITLPRSGSIEGKLVGFGVAPSVIATDSSEDMRTAAVTGDTFSIAGLKPGRYSVVAKDTNGADVRSVTVSSEVAAGVELHAGGTGRIEGRITFFTTGEPKVTRCMASAGMNGYAPWWNFDAAVESDASGHFTIDPAPAGRTRVICLGDARAQRDVIVPAGGTVATSLVSVEMLHRHTNAGFSMLEDQNPPTVAMIEAKGAAAMAGLAVGDQIVSVDGISVDSFGVDGVAALVENHAAGTTAVLVILRGGAQRTIALVLH